MPISHGNQTLSIISDCNFEILVDCRFVDRMSSSLRILSCASTTGLWYARHKSISLFSRKSPRGASMEQAIDDAEKDSAPWFSEWSDNDWQIETIPTTNQVLLLPQSVVSASSIQPKSSEYC
jgi:hypothetical protein